MTTKPDNETTVQPTTVADATWGRPPTTVTEAIARVMVELPAIGKKKHPSEDGRGLTYAYRGIEEITSEAQGLFAKYGVVFAGGQGQLADSIFRIGHLGFVNETDVLTAMAVIGAVLNEMGFACDTGVGIEAARAEL